MAVCISFDDVLFLTFHFTTSHFVANSRLFIRSLSLPIISRYLVVSCYDSLISLNIVVFVGFIGPLCFVPRRFGHAHQFPFTTHAMSYVWVNAVFHVKHHSLTGCSNGDAERSRLSELAYMTNRHEFALDRWKAIRDIMHV